MEEFNDERRSKKTKIILMLIKNVVIKQMKVVLQIIAYPVTLIFYYDINYTQMHNLFLTHTACKISFFTFKYLKTRLRNRLTDEYLETICFFF